MFHDVSQWDTSSQDLTKVRIKSMTWRDLDQSPVNRDKSDTAGKAMYTTEGPTTLIEDQPTVPTPKMWPDRKSKTVKTDERTVWGKFEVQSRHQLRATGSSFFIVLFPAPLTQFETSWRLETLNFEKPKNGAITKLFRAQVFTEKPSTLRQTHASHKTSPFDLISSSKSSASIANHLTFWLSNVYCLKRIQSKNHTHTNQTCQFEMERTD